MKIHSRVNGLPNTRPRPAAAAEEGSEEATETAVGWVRDIDCEAEGFDSDDENELHDESFEATWRFWKQRSLAAEDGELVYPNSVCVTHELDIVIMDFDRLQVFRSDGTFLRVIARGGEYGMSGGCSRLCFCPITHRIAAISNRGDAVQMFAC